MTDRSIDGDSPRAVASRVLDALGAAWTTHRLYPNPVAQPAFQRAVDAMAEVTESEVVFDVGPGAFSWNGEEIDSERDGVERLAKQLYVRDIEAIRFDQGPSGHDLNVFFRIVAGDDTVGARIQEELEEAGVGSLVVRQRALLTHLYPEGGADLHGGGYGESEIGVVADERPARESAVADLVERGATVDQVVEVLTELGNGDPREMSGAFIDAFREVHSDDEPVTADVGRMLKPYWHDEDPGRVMRTFIETFFQLDDDVKALVFAEVLEDPRMISSRVFLDQLSGRDLAVLGDAVGGDRYEVLLEYIRETVDVRTADAESLLPYLESAHAVSEARSRSASFAGVLVDSGVDIDSAVTSAERFLAELAACDGDEQLLHRVMRALTEVETRPRRFRRMLRVWGATVLGAMREGRFDEALTTVELLRRDPLYSPEFAEAVNVAIAGLLTPEALTVMIDTSAEEGSESGVDAILELLGGPVVERLIEQLAEEENPRHRKVLMDLVVKLGRGHIRTIARFTNDPRWFVVRNLATVLGRVGDSRAVPLLKKLLRHSDQRVRVEALRAIAPLGSKEIGDLLVASLSDESERVRSTAANLLVVTELEDIDAKLLAVLEEGTAPAEQLGRITQALVKRGGAETHQALERLANKSFALRSNQRALRQVIRQALGK